MTTEDVLRRAKIRRGQRVGTVEMARCVLDLYPGTRVVWGGDRSRVISTIEVAEYGHRIVKFADGSCSRYRPDGVVQVLELTDEAPLEVAA